MLCYVNWGNKAILEMVCRKQDCDLFCLLQAKAGKLAEQGVFKYLSITVLKQTIYLTA